jgi:hypothetical protein
MTSLKLVLSLPKNDNILHHKIFLHLALYEYGIQVIAMNLLARDIEVLTIKICRFKIFLGGLCPS